MEFSALVLYDFQKEGENELNLRSGERITILNTEVGDGWWFGRTESGSEGLFPASYVETEPEPGTISSSSSRPNSYEDTGAWNSAAARSEPAHQDTWTSSSSAYRPDPGWGIAPVPKPQVAQDDFSSEEDSSSSATPAPMYTVARKPSQQQSRNAGDKGKQFSLAKISAFGKSGGFDNYLMGGIDAAATRAGEGVTIAEDGSGYYYWNLPSESSYTCVVGVPKKGAKFGGLKAFMTYPVTPSFNNVQVSRRYKQFDWLHEQLTAKFGVTIAIPPLPDKQVTGRFEEELIEIRRIELQSFADRICRHPVLSQSAVWKHFISETDEKRWTAGKRKAESDPLVGPGFLTTLQTPESEGNEDAIALFVPALLKLDSAVKNMYSLTQEQSNRYRSGYKKSIQNLGGGFQGLSASLNGQLPQLEKIGTSFVELGDVFETQAQRSWDPMVHMLHDYKGLAGSWADILGSYSAAKDRQKELESGAGDKERFAARSRINTYRIGVQAEKNYFMQEIQEDLSQASQTFVLEQMRFYREMASRMETLYKDCWGDAPPPPLPALPTQPRPASNNLNAWGGHDNGIYEEMP